jgi:hypothetical protein
MVMGRPLKPEHLKRTKVFPLRLTNREWAELAKAARELGQSVASILRNGGMLYIHQRGKGGSKAKGEKNK